MSKDRLQINIRVEPEDLEMVEDLRRAFTPIPPATAIWRQALKEMHARHVRAADQKGKRK